MHGVEQKNRIFPTNYGNKKNKQVCGVGWVCSGHLVVCIFSPRFAQKAKRSAWKPSRFVSIRFVSFHLQKESDVHACMHITYSQSQ